MTKHTKQTPFRVKVACAIVTAFVLGAGTLGQAADLDPAHAWTVVGSTGTVDPRDADRVVMRRNLVTTSAAARRGSVTIRYNIQATDALVGSMPAGDLWNLKVAFRDSGPSERVRAFLIGQSLGGGRPDVVLSFDSDDYNDRAQAAPRMEIVETSGVELDFEENAYRLVVILTKYGPRAAPAFTGASLSPKVSAP